ncbi:MULTISPECIES: hypothetical protein [Methanosarcina]|uniref:Uncharacterized protein n=3 Tax=Methanosarcina barkeri TaxID=2208 RepID=A0A0E3QSQ7_METBA|nr:MULTISPECIES: hypothetical protein [Methanosarcina]AKB53555.1 hypothetical protein MSBRM_0557 [Methanosarcina barkeri MS]AKB58338.1 hypothetical protein MSBR2_1822 [Methanosarcina barkeri 227]AKJ39126.1 hypothetical protein MCM1_2107 [Methanosarcina barkeri CM1]OED03718.1 hypothetical protein A9239_13525 [Methanosarcina sp. A14]
MTLPEVCPLDESQTCKGRECHLFCLEWRSREPICLIGYSITSRIKSGKAGRNRDTYAEDTFRKLGRQPLSKRKDVSEIGDWTPSRLTNKSSEQSVERNEERFSKNRHFQETDVKKPDQKPEGNHDERQRYAPSDAEKASIRLESGLKIEPVEQSPVIHAKIEPKVQEKPKTPEKVISRDKHTTIFAPFNNDKKDDSCLPGREEKVIKSAENKEKRKKLDKAMEIDLPDTYDEDFWS